MPYRVCRRQVAARHDRHGCPLHQRRSSRVPIRYRRREAHVAHRARKRRRPVPRGAATPPCANHEAMRRGVPARRAHRPSQSPPDVPSQRPRRRHREDARHDRLEHHQAPRRGANRRTGTVYRRSVRRNPAPPSTTCYQRRAASSPTRRVRHRATRTRHARPARPVTTRRRAPRRSLAVARAGACGARVRGDRIVRPQRVRRQRVR